MEHVSQADRESVETVAGVHLAQLAATEGMSVQRFRIEPGATVPEHSHDHEQVGYVTGGEATFVVDGERYRVGPGDSYAIPGDEPHTVEVRGDEPLVGVDVFHPPREAPDWDG